MILKRSWNAFWRKVDLPAAMVFIMAALAGVGVAVLVSSALDRRSRSNRRRS
ncbi:MULTISPECIES: hypothetical protein [unclassified Mesorhizobium]|uniref:hypothetical protein n=1 Tax=unclassified Mesorhizobium TaxID=325217 RepID=UPI0003CFC340|nr:hypothetical protein [Mesorhizobium sp. L48C026A00]ESZ04462.1 hypothetical protein X737_36860 [Mesorhizobium sp. L48C026A00]